MTDSEVDEILISLGWQKLLRKDHLMLFRKYDHDLQIYSYKSKYIFIRGGATEEGDGWVTFMLRKTLAGTFSGFQNCSGSIFFKFGELTRQFSSILEIFCMNAANLSSDKTAKFLLHADTPIDNIHMKSVDVTDKCASFLVSPKTLNILMICATSTFVITFFQCYFRYKNCYIKN